MRYFKRDLFLFVFLILAACSSSPSENPAPGGNPTFSQFNYLALGDSLTMGVQDGTTNEFTQAHSYAAVVAQQISLAYGTSFSLPLFNLDGTRKNPAELPTILGVSGEDVFSLLNEKAGVLPEGGRGSLHERAFAPIPDAKHRNAPTSQLEAALWMAEKWKSGDPSLPKIISLWIGNNEILGSIVQVGGEDYTAEGIRAALTLPENFRQDLRRILEGLKTTGAHVFVGDIPNIAEIAYLVRPELVERWTGLEIPIDRVPPGAKISLFAALNLLADFRSGKDWAGSLAEHLSDLSVMSEEELSIIEERIGELNAILNDLVAEFGFIKVSLHDVLRSPNRIDGVLFTNDWGAGNFFSLDGVHFSNTGHAYVANLFIQAINRALNASISPVPIHPVWAQDPYRDEDGDGFPVGPSYTPSDEIVEVLFSFKDQNDSDPLVGMKSAVLSLRKEIQAALNSSIRFSGR